MLNLIAVTQVLWFFDGFPRFLAGMLDILYVSVFVGVAVQVWIEEGEDD